MECENFKLSVRESATDIRVEPETVNETENQRLPPTESHPPSAVVAGPSSQPSSQKEPSAVARRATAHTPEDDGVEPSAGRSDDEIERENMGTDRILQKPFSEQATDGTDPIAGTEAWVNRSIQERRSEFLPHAKVKRPHNPWILYVRTYNGAARKMLGHIEARHVIRILSQSWRMESANLRARFFALADTEKIRHEQAFPYYRLHYRFSPRPALE